MAVMAANEKWAAWDGHEPAPDPRALGTAHRDVQEQLQHDEQAGGRASGQGAAAAAWQRWAPRQRDGGQQRAVLQRQERPIERAAGAGSNHTGDTARDGCVTALSVLLVEDTPCCTTWAPWGSMGSLAPMLLATVLYNVMFVATVSVAAVWPKNYCTCTPSTWTPTWAWRRPAYGILPYPGKSGQGGVPAWVPHAC